MSDAEPEYEVESIVEARTELASGGKRGRKQKLIWKYRVRWKGYSSDDDTWEPVESFDGASDAVKTFWEKANTGGRDRNNMTLFKAGETFLPLGPPRKPKSKPSTHLAAPSSHATPPASSRKRVLDEAVLPSSQRLSKRRRGNAPGASNTVETTSPAASTSQSAKIAKQKPSSSRAPGRKAPARSPSQEIIPDSESEEEMEVLGLSLPLAGDTESSASQERSQVQHGMESNGLAIGSPARKAAAALVPVSPIKRAQPIRNEVIDSTSTQPSSTRAKAKGKAPEVSSPSASSGLKRTRSGVGRASLGATEPKSAPARASKRRRGNATEPSLNDVLQPVPSSTAGANKGDTAKSCEATPLVAVEADDIDRVLSDVEKPPAVEEQTLDPEEQARLERINVVKDQLFPTTSISLSPTVGGWGRPSTIFGPLGFGSSLSEAKLSVPTTQMILTLDSSLSIPIEFYETPSPELVLTTTSGTKGTPGKFYRPEAALALLDALKSKGGTALARVTPSASPEEAQHFTQFSTRLTTGDLFVAVAGVDILVFYAATNQQFAQRLNTPPILVNRPHVVVVTKVDIEDFSRYAAAAVDADPNRWEDYIKDGMS